MLFIVSVSLIDNCVRYLVSYTDELAKYGFSLPQIMVKVRGLVHFIG